MQRSKVVALAVILAVAATFAGISERRSTACFRARLSCASAAEQFHLVYARRKTFAKPIPRELLPRALEAHDSAGTEWFREDELFFSFTIKNSEILERVFVVHDERSELIAETGKFLG
jgi:hypothetical protein